jgi:hypothetical protein
VYAVGGALIFGLKALGQSLGNVDIHGTYCSYLGEFKNCTKLRKRLLGNEQQGNLRNCSKLKEWLLGNEQQGNLRNT